MTGGGPYNLDVIRLAQMLIPIGTVLKASFGHRTGQCDRLRATEQGLLLEGWPVL
jgi:hypothetical protein